MPPTTYSNKKAEVPLFIRKLYYLLNTCDPKLASWTIKGDGFYVRDPDTFATDIIPQFFTHNKFSSFVRQLNYFGFRKVKQESIKIAAKSESKKCIVFFHDRGMFQRGREDLLALITRAPRGSAVCESAELRALKVEVKSLRSEMCQMKRTMNDVIGLVQNIVEAGQRNRENTPQEHEPSLYKPGYMRMTFADAAPDVASSSTVAQTVPISDSTHDSMPTNDVPPQTFKMKRQSMQPLPMDPFQSNLYPMKQDKVHRSESINSNISFDPTVLNEILSGPLSENIEEELALLTDIENRSNEQHQRQISQTPSMSPLKEESTALQTPSMPLSEESITLPSMSPLQEESTALPTPSVPSLKEASTASPTPSMPPLKEESSTLPSCSSVLDADQKLRKKLNESLGYFSEENQHALIGRLIASISDAHTTSSQFDLPDDLPYELPPDYCYGQTRSV